MWGELQTSRKATEKWGDLLPVPGMASTLGLFLFWYCLLVPNPGGFLPHHISCKNHSTKNWRWGFAEGESVSWLWSGGQVNIKVRFLCLPLTLTSCISSHLWPQSGTEDSRVMRSPDQAGNFQQCFDFECKFSLWNVRGNLKEQPVA